MYGSRRGNVFMGFMWGLMAITAILIVLITISTYYTVSDCHKKGGEMVGTGEYTTHMIYAGEGVYTTMETENTKCNKE